MNRFKAKAWRLALGTWFAALAACTNADDDGTVRLTAALPSGIAVSDVRYLVRSETGDYLREGQLPPTAPSSSIDFTLGSAWIEIAVTAIGSSHTYRGTSPPVHVVPVQTTAVVVTLEELSSEPARSQPPILSPASDKEGRVRNWDAPH